MRWMLHALVCAGLVACTPAAEGPTEDPHAAEEHHVTPEVAAEAPDHGSGETAEEAAAAEGPRSFGAAIDEDRPVTALATIVDEPDSYADRIVRTEGEIARVCQAMGCWMELRESEDGPAVRIPMAGHAFFLPRDVAGRRASIEAASWCRS
jgi:hypothetical protein